MDEMIPVPASQTEMVMRRIAMPGMMNPNGIMFGGVLLSFYDEFSGIVGYGFAKRWVTTASVENVTFSRPIHAGETVVIHGRVIYTGRTSFVVRLDTEVECAGVLLGSAGSALFNYVAIDENGCPTQIPQLLLETEDDKRLWAEAEMARKARGG